MWNVCEVDNNDRFYKFMWCSIGDFEKVNAGSIDEL